jgi:hypothetical protein
MPEQPRLRRPPAALAEVEQQRPHRIELGARIEPGSSALPSIT